MATLTCPAARCKTENDLLAEFCTKCGTPLRGYARLSAYPNQLFNMGLAAARGGNLARARDLLAAVVYWCPLDLEARNALAQACYTQGDTLTAREHWEIVLSRSPGEPLASRGLAALTTSPAKEKTTKTKSRKKKPKKRR